MLDVGRRKFLAALAGAVVCPRAAGAQEVVRRVGVLMVGAGNDPAWQVYAAALRQGLAETGYVEGRNLTIDYRWAEGKYDRLPALTADLVRQKVAVIVAGANPSAMAARAATTTIPIVFWVNQDPVALGLVASFNRPGGNLTGIVTLSGELGPKRLELMRELVPAATTVAVLVNPTNPGSEAQSREMKVAASALGLQLQILHASTEHDLDQAFAALIQLRAGGLVINSDGFFVGRSEYLAALALRHAVPTIFQYREFAAAGGLMSYGGNIADAIRLAGVYTGRVLKDEKPADLPIQQATKVELFLNLKTAKTFGLTVPNSLLGRADEVIE
jgi:putative tryptophan/tyrosine transport system substrate-binding protein